MGNILNHIGYSRGGYDPYGSVIWADVNEALKLPDELGYSFHVLFRHALNIIFESSIRIYFRYFI